MHTYRLRDCALSLCEQDKLSMFQFFRSRKAEPRLPQIEASVPEGQRVYAVGDIHGRSDLLIALIEAIEIMVATALEVSIDLKEIGGATH